MRKGIRWGRLRMMKIPVWKIGLYHIFCLSFINIGIIFFFLIVLVCKKLLYNCIHRVPECLRDLAKIVCFYTFWEKLVPFWCFFGKIALPWKKVCEPHDCICQYGSKSEWLAMQSKYAQDKLKYVCFISIFPMHNF